MFSFLSKIASSVYLKKLTILLIQAIIIGLYFRKICENKSIDTLGSRSSEIVKVLVSEGEHRIPLHQGLENIILSFDAPCFEENKKIQYILNLPEEDYSNMSITPQNCPTALLTLSMCRHLISAIITLNNGLLATCTFRGLIHIWDPFTGTLVSTFYKLEWYCNQIHEPNPQIFEMSQVSDNVIAFINHNVCVRDGVNGIHFLNMVNDTMIRIPNFLNPRRQSGTVNVSLFFCHKLRGNIIDGIIIATSNTLTTLKIKEKNEKDLEYLYEHESFSNEKDLEYLYEHESFSNELIEKDFQIIFVENVEILLVSSMIIIGHNKESDTGIENNLIICMNKLTKKTKKYYFSDYEKIIGKPLIIGMKVLITLTDKQTCESRKYIIFNLLTFLPMHVLDSLTNKLVEHLIWLKDNFVAAYVFGNQNSDDKKKSNKIFVIDIMTRIAGQTIDIGEEKIRAMASHLNGFTTVSYMSKIKTYSSTDPTNDAK